MKPEGYHTVRTPYVRFFAAAVKFLRTQLSAVYGVRWRAEITADPGAWRVRFIHWDAAGLESKETFSISEE